MGVKALIDRVRHLLFFLLASCAYHYKAFTGGILIAPNNDALFYNYPVKHLYSYALKGFQFPLWNPYEFAGIPFMGTLQSGVLYPVNLVLYSFLSPPYAFNASYILHFALAGWFTYLYLRLLGLGGLPAFAGGMVFGFSGFMLSNKDHTAIVNSAAWLPLIMYLYEKLRRKPALEYGLLIALAVAVQVFAGSFQIFFYTFMVIGIFLVFYSVYGDPAGRSRLLIFGLLGLFGGILIALPQIVSTAELSGLSWLRNRKLFLGYDYFTMYHVYLEMLTTLIFPRLFGPHAPGDGVAILIGSMPVVLSAVVFIKERKINHHVRFWGIAGLAGLFLSLGGDNPLYMLLYHVPAYNLIRAHGRHLFEFTFAVSVLFGIGLERMLSAERRGYARSFALSLASVIITAAVLLLLLYFLNPGGVNGYLRTRGYQNLHLMRETLSVKNAAVYIPFAIMSLYLLWAAASAMSKKNLFRYIVAALLAAEIFIIGDYSGITGPSISESIDLCGNERLLGYAAADKKDYRVFSAVSVGYFSKNDCNPTANLTCKTASIGGYDPLYLDSYSAMVWDLGYLGLGTMPALERILRNNVVLGMLGGRYVQVSKDMDLGLDGIEADSSAPKRAALPGIRFNASEGVERREGFYRMVSPDGEKMAVMYKGFSILKGSYAVTFRARAPEGAKKCLGLYLFSIDEANKISVLEAYDGKLMVPADYLGKDFKDFHQTINVDKDDLYILFIATASKYPIEITGFSMERFEHYSPPPLARNAGDGIPVYEKIFEAEDYIIYENKNSLPKAWPVTELVAVGDFEDAKRRLDFLEVNPSRQAILYEGDVDEIGQSAFSGGEVSVESYALNNISLRVRFPGRGFVVLSEQYYPGWKSFIDGKETKIYPVNGILRGVVVPGGEHVVAFSYRPYAILSLMALSLALTAGIVVYLIGKWRRLA